MPELLMELGAVAWKVEDQVTRQAICWGTTQTTSEECDVSAYHSELQGIQTLLFPYWQFVSSFTLWRELSPSAAAT
jgi:hypothetical protein